METTKVLIVEDNIADTELVKSMLKTPGGEFIISNVDRLSSATHFSMQGRMTRCSSI
jgi:hypothetical protein